jgi:membrane protein required for colicin V production
MELFFLLAIVLGVFLGFRLMGAGIDYLHREFDADTKLLPYIAFAVIFAGVMIAVTLLGRSIKSMVDTTFLGKVDSLAGGILGGTKYLFCASVVFWIFGALRFDLPPNWIAGSWLYAFVAGFAPKAAVAFGHALPVFNDIFKQF